MKLNNDTHKGRSFGKSCSLQRSIMYVLASVFCLLIGTFQNVSAQQPVPVFDKKHNAWSNILQQVQTATFVVNSRVTLVVDKIKNVQEFVSRAHTVVSGVVKNIRMVNQTIQVIQDINALVQSSIDTLNAPHDHDLDGEDDLYYINKWKHIQILLTIADQADSVWELFQHALENDTYIMDDKGRLTIIQDAYKDALSIKVAIRIQLRRIQKEIFHYQRKRREVLAFQQLFQTN